MSSEQTSGRQGFHFQPCPGDIAPSWGTPSGPKTLGLVLQKVRAQIWRCGIPKSRLAPNKEVRPRVAPCVAPQPLFQGASWAFERTCSVCPHLRIRILPRPTQAMSPRHLPKVAVRHRRVRGGAGGFVGQITGFCARRGAPFRFGGRAPDSPFATRTIARRRGKAQGHGARGEEQWEVAGQDKEGWRGV